MTSRLFHDEPVSSDLRSAAVGPTRWPDIDDEARFRAAFKRHYDALLAYAMRRTTTRDDAEEVVATAFATAWRRIRDMPDEPGTVIWLYRVTWRTLANHRRGNARRGRLFDRVASLRLDDDDGSEFESVVDEIDERVLLAFRSLKPKEQEVLRLTVWEELSYAQAAEVLGCSLNAFAIRLHRARASLRQAVLRIDENRSAQGAS
jgi:RNA polymerase sigma-70 factor (ECF subfamily)